VWGEILNAKAPYWRARRQKARFDLGAFCGFKLAALIFKKIIIVFHLLCCYNYNEMAA